MSKEAKVALLAVVALVALFVGFRFLKGSNVFSSDRTFYAVYDNVDGLNDGAAVLLNGVAVGQVKKRELLPAQANKVRVSLEIRKDVEVGDSTLASLSGSLLGSKSVTLLQGRNTKIFEGGEELRSYHAASLTDAFQAKALPVLGTVDSTLIRVNQFLSKEARLSLQQTLLNSQATTEALRNLLVANQRNINRITTNMAELSSSLAVTERKFDAVATNLALITDTLKRAPLAKTVRDLNTTVAQTQATIKGLNQQLNSTKGSLGLLLNDDSLYTNLNATSASANALLVDLKANPKRYVHFSVFGGGGKEKKKSESEVKPDGTRKRETKTVTQQTSPAPVDTAVRP
ncbi:MlaD family protein [Hymenobacter sp. 15J16-1T3B]|uniref:MlaD family protein n=1 Tax=Hymenobacter sp. 15J16-1T3B TaxID=2886941 RepID=UPI001D117580|nr:MlaD family protein [Hymenobacter sp. 15J16-1T3B]MCC3157220.1 MlaD family protein [Hymenobacter sp. 15J16-1T3B]